MASDLAVFKGARTKTTGPYITISTRKTFTLSVGLLRHANPEISAKTHAMLSFSKANNAIVFNFIATEDSPGAIKISFRGNATLAARSFFDYYAIDIDKYTGKYLARFENIPSLGRFWVLYLDEKINRHPKGDSTGDADR